MPVSDWSDLMPSTVSYRSLSGRDEYGNATLNASVSYKCRYTQTSRRVTSRVTGDDVISSSVIWLDGVLTNINVDDQFTLPDGAVPQILDWLTVSDEKGPHHTKIYFK